MNIGIGIRSIRTERGITQHELAEMCDLSPTSVSQIENGIKRPSSRNLKKICEVLQVPEPLIYILAMQHTDVPDNRQNAYQLFYPSVRDMLMQMLGVKMAG